LTDDLVDIIRAAQRGDESAFRRLIERHFAYAYRVAYRVLLDPDDAQDAAQNAFIKLWQQLGTFNTAMNFTTWFYRIVANAAIDHHRRATRQHAAARSHGTETAPPAHAPAESREIGTIVRSLLSRLPAVQRLVFALRDVEDLSVDEVATVTGMSTSSVRTNLSYARKKVRDLLSTEYDIRGTS